MGEAGEFCRAGLTKAAMAAPSREVTAAKETTRKMMMALTQRRKSWGDRGAGPWLSAPWSGATAQEGGHGELRQGRGAQKGSVCQGQGRNPTVRSGT